MQAAVVLLIAMGTFSKLPHLLIAVQCNLKGYSCISKDETKVMYHDTRNYNKCLRLCKRTPFCKWFVVSNRAFPCQVHVDDCQGVKACDDIEKCILGGPNCSRLPEEVCNCGHANHFAQPMIIGGVDALPNEFPWQILLLKRIQINGVQTYVFTCGATIINRYYALSAAHCVNTDTAPAKYKISVGQHYIDQKFPPLGFNVQVKKITMHPMYKLVNATDNHSMNHLIFDFALLRTKYPIGWSEVAGPACLPQNNESDYEGVLATMSGWGINNLTWTGFPENSSYTNPLVLQKLQSLVIMAAKESCDKLKVNPEVEICATDLNKSGCFGDSGGPLVTNIYGRYTLIGVAAWAHEICSGPVTVFARVTTALPWIKKVVRGTGICYPE